MRAHTSVPWLLAVATSAHAEPPPRDFAELELGLGVASVHHDPCVDGCSLDNGGAALLHVGGGAGVFLSSRLSLIVRIHGSIAIGTTQSTYTAFQLFGGLGARVTLARLSNDDQAVFELATGYETLFVPDGGSYKGLALAPRLGLRLGHAALAMSSTVQLDRSSATQDDVTFVVGLHFER